MDVKTALNQIANKLSSFKRNLVIQLLHLSTVERIEKSTFITNLECVANALENTTHNILALNSCH